MAVTALILAGGKATRLGGIAKHELVVMGETIFQRQVRVLAPRVAKILVSGASVAGYRSVRDAAEGIGPLAGIAAGLAAIAGDPSDARLAEHDEGVAIDRAVDIGGRDAASSWLLVVAGDMPYLTGELIDAMLALCGADVDAVGVRVRGLPEPLLCVLHARVRGVVERRIAAGRYKASGLLTDEQLRVSWLDDPDARVLVNINSPIDLLR